MSSIVMQFWSWSLTADRWLLPRSLYLVFEHLDLDLKKYMDCNKDFCKDHQLVKVRCSLCFFEA